MALDARPSKNRSANVKAFCWRCVGTAENVLESLIDGNMTGLA
jgi:hypothetical protein